MELVYHWKWELGAPPAALWPLVSDTQRVNELFGLAPWHFTRRTDARDTASLRGKTRRLGLALEWDEYPFEWVAPREFGVQRVYHAGPINELRSKVHLSPLPGGGTLLEHTLTVTPANAAAGLVVRLDVGVGLKGSFDRAYRQLDQEALAAKPGARAGPAPLARDDPRRDRARDAVQRLATRGHDASVVERLVAHVLDGPAREVDRIRPFALARRWGTPAVPFLKACIDAARDGLLETSWDLVCPGCRGAGGRVQELRELKGEAHCPSCDVRVETGLERSVELTFRPSPVIRDVSVATFCTGGPAKTPHVVLQRRLAPGAKERVEVALDAGSYRVRSPGTPATASLEDGSALAVESAGDLALTTDGKAISPSHATAKGPTLALVLANATDRERVVLVESTEWKDDAVTAAFVVTLEEFRRAFPRQVVAQDVQVGVGRVAILFTDLKSSTETYERLGDGGAYALVHDHFAVLKKAVLSHQGTVVKTIGDAVMGAFADPAEGLRACFDIHEGIAAYNAEKKPPSPIVVKLALHTGGCLIVNENERLDYFGRTVNIAARLERESRGGDVIVTDELLQDPACRAALAERPHREESFDASLKGLEGRFKLVRLTQEKRPSA